MRSASITPRCEGNDKSKQPSNMQEVLHKTAVSWMRVRLRNSTSKRSWEESREAYASRLHRCRDDVNDELDVDVCAKLFRNESERCVTTKADDSIGRPISGAVVGDQSGLCKRWRASVF